MSMLDWGVIAVSGHKIIDLPHAGAMAEFTVPKTSLKFYKAQVHDSHHSDGFYISFNDLELVPKADDVINHAYFALSDLPPINHPAFVLAWTYENINFKTKRVGWSIYRTEFKLGDAHYAVLSGYDIDLKRFGSKQTFRVVDEFLRRTTKQPLSYWRQQKYQIKQSLRA